MINMLCPDVSTTAEINRSRSSRNFSPRDKIGCLPSVYMCVLLEPTICIATAENPETNKDVRVNLGIKVVGALASPSLIIWQRVQCTKLYLRKSKISKVHLFAKRRNLFMALKVFEIKPLF